MGMQVDPGAVGVVVGLLNQALRPLQVGSIGSHIHVWARAPVVASNKEVPACMTHDSAASDTSNGPQAIALEGPGGMGGGGGGGVNSAF